MAKDKKPDLSTLTPKEVLEAINLLKKSGLEMDESAHRLAIELLNTLTQQQGAIENSIAALQRRLVHQTDANSQEADNVKKQIANLNQVEALVTRNFTTINRLTSEQSQRSQAHHDAEVSSIRRTDEALKKALLSKKEHNKAAADGVLNFKKMTELAPAIKEGAEAGAKALSTEMIAAHYLGLLDLEKAAVKVAAMPGDMDTALRKVTKETGLAGRAFEDVMIGSLDVIDAQRRGFAALDGAEAPFENIGLTIKETGQTVKDLTDNTSTYRKTWMEQNKETAIYTTNLLSTLGKVDVKSATSAKILDSLIKAHGETPKEANKSLLSVVSIADSLEINIGGATERYAALSDDLAQWGDRATTVFAGLETQSLATGIASGRLAEITGKWDTFSGAASAVQGFNAAMGETLLSVDELVHATPEEKIILLQKAMKDSGKSFEEADRFTKKQIASLLDLKNVGEAARLFRPPEEVEGIRARVREVPMAPEDLRGKVEASMTHQEMLEKNMSSVGRGMADITKEVRTTSINALEALSKAMAATAGGTKSARDAAFAYRTELQLMGVAAKIAERKAGAMVKVTAGAGGAWEIFKGELEKELPEGTPMPGSIKEVIDLIMKLKETPVKAKGPAGEKTSARETGGAPGVAAGAELAGGKVPFILQNNIILPDGTVIKTEETPAVAHAGGPDAGTITKGELAEILSPGANPMT